MGGFENATKVCRSRCIRCVTDFSEEEGMCVKKKKEKKVHTRAAATVFIHTATFVPALKISNLARARARRNK